MTPERDLIRVFCLSRVNGEKMEFYDDEKNVNDYIKMAEGFDGRDLIKILQKYLPSGASLLELGMGPGVDLEMLSEQYNVTGSDNSQVFLDRFSKIQPSIKTLKLDAQHIQCDQKYDCIYSNKVLHHFTDDVLGDSLRQQMECLSDGGILFHTFWQGEGDETMHGMYFNYQSIKNLTAIIADMYEVLEMMSYREMEEDDSLYVVLRKI